VVSDALGLPAPALSLRGISKSFGPTRALEGVSFNVRPGTIHGLVGGNGSGKSTLIKVLAGVHTADAGEIGIGTRTVDATHIDPRQSRDLGLCFVHQQRSTFADLTVAENLAIGSGFRTGPGARIKWATQRARAAELLERFGIRASPDTELGMLSPASQTMVAIARALQDREELDSGVLVLDEPTASLPLREVDLLLESLKRYASEGQTILYVSHRLEEITAITDDVTVLRDGHHIATISGTSTQSELIELMTGRAVDALAQQERHPQREELALEVRNLTAGAARDVSFDVCQGEILGIAGLLGSGRSSVLRALFGELPAQAGEVLIGGQATLLQSPRDAMSLGIAYVPEDREGLAAFPDLSILENLGLADTSRYFKQGRLRHRKERCDAHELIADFGIKAGSVEDALGTLSGGNAQKVILARWLRRDPKVILLDEPSQGVDVGARFDIWAIVHRAVAQGAAAIVVSSDFEELAGVCDRVIVLTGGSINAELDGADVAEHTIDRLVLSGEKK